MAKKFKNQKGQGVMEYVILTSLVGILCLVTVKQFGTVLKQRINDMKKHIVENVEIGN